MLTSLPNLATNAGLPFFPGHLYHAQLAIDARVTSDDLAQAVNANSDKIVAVQSAVDTALSDRFRRMQDMVHAQVCT